MTDASWTCALARRGVAWLLSLVIAVGGGRAATAEDWPQFRGINASGVSPSKNIPAKFSHTENVRWNVELGEGIASSVIASGRVFSTSMTGPKTFTVYCHSADAGKPLWRRDFDTGPLPRITPPNSHASSTPAADAKRVYVYFSTLGLLALDAESGADVWKYSMKPPAYLMDWGAASSPILHGNLVLFNHDDDLTPYLLAVDSAKGTESWKAPRPDMLAGYSVPVVVEAKGQTDIVLAGCGKMKGYDPATGAERWTCNTLVRTMMTSPVVKEGVIYVASQSYGDSTRTLKFALLEWLDTNQDQKLAKTEVPKEFLDKFGASDINKDGFIADEELDTAFQSRANMVGGGNIIQAIQGGGKGDVTKTHLLWNVTKPFPSNLSSPLVTGKRVLVVKAGGLSTCLDAGDGSSLWERARIQNFGDHFASPVAADGKIFIAGRNGFVIVISDSGTLSILEKNDMAGEIIATPSIADGRLYIRTREKLFCIGEGK